MDFKCMLCVVILASVITTSSASCRIIHSENPCVYTVICVTHAGSAPNPTCEDGRPNVTFIVQESNVETLMTRFFASTNFDSRVRTIKAVENSWTTIDSSAFRYYSYCLSIDLSQNNIAKINAGAFRSLNRLQYLNLSGNSIERFDVDSFKISDSWNTVIEVLDLSDNNLLELSTELNALSGLKELYLQNNKLKIIADNAFFQLKNLNQLNIRNNRIDTLNSSLNQLKMLTHFDASYNNLTILTGHETIRLVSILEFNASHNSISYVESNCFNQAFSLQKLDFSFNHINMTIENVMFINNNQLGYINFYSNYIIGIEENTFKHNNLYYLNIQNNFISGYIKENTFYGLGNVTELNLSRQNIIGIKNKTFDDTKNILYLNLSNNLITEIEKSSFIESSITILDLSYNRISSLYFLNDCLSNITELYINNNQIAVIPPNVFDGKNAIKKLDLSINYIKNIESFLLPLSNIQYLNIIGNNITGVIKKNVFSPAKYLKFLNLSNFNITKIDDSAFVDLPVLARLILANNQIENIHPNNFKGVDNMYSLDLSHNNIEDFQFDSSILKNLQALYLNNNKLMNISRLFTNESKLLYLDISNNNICDNFFMGSDVIPNITTLYLDNNTMTYFNNPKTNTLVKLLDLRLSFNNISAINLSYYKDLTSLDLSYNNLAFINYTIFEKNDLLQALDISQNKINDLPPGTFRTMKNLKFLNISGNRLTKLRYGSLKGLHKTDTIDLSKNLITALDVDLFHECDELKSLIIDYNLITTFDVERLISSLPHLKALSLGGNPISCKEMVQNVKPAKKQTDAREEVKTVEVTSIDKIYHEDNVLGIKCGNDASSVLEPVSPAENSPMKSGALSPTDLSSESALSSTSVALIWCSILIVLIVVSGVFIYLKVLRKRVSVVNMPLRNSRCSMDGSEFQADLLN